MRYRIPSRRIIASSRHQIFICGSDVKKEEERLYYSVAKRKHSDRNGNDVCRNIWQQNEHIPLSAVTFLEKLSMNSNFQKKLSINGGQTTIAIVSFLIILVLLYISNVTTCSTLASPSKKKHFINIFHTIPPVDNGQWTSFIK